MKNLIFTSRFTLALISAKKFLHKLSQLLQTNKQISQKTKLITIDPPLLQKTDYKTESRK